MASRFLSLSRPSLMVAKLRLVGNPRSMACAARSNSAMILVRNVRASIGQVEALVGHCHGNQLWLPVRRRARLAA